MQNYLLLLKIFCKLILLLAASTSNDLIKVFILLKTIFLVIDNEFLVIIYELLVIIDDL